MQAGLAHSLPSVSGSVAQSTALLALLIVAFASRMPELMVVYVLVAVGMLVVNLQLFGGASTKERNATLVVIATVTLMLPLSTIRSETALLHYVEVLVSLGAAFVLTRNLPTYRLASQLTLLAAQAAICIYLANTGLLGFPLDNMIPESSSNGVTSYMVLLQANYCLVNLLLARGASLPTAAVTLAICIVGYGRGSIIAAAGIVAVGAWWLLTARGYRRVVLLLPFVAVAGVLLYAEYGELIADFVTVNTKIGSGLGDVHREAIIGEYLERIDAVTIWTGASYDGTSILSEYNSNPHNAYIRAHYIFGLPYLLLIFLLPLYLRVRRVPGPVATYSLAMFVIVLFRAFTEPLLFPTLFDFYYFAMCFALARPAVSVRHEHASAARP